jgi:hypothetical protein
MKWLWTWDGRFFGYLRGEDLWTYGGKHVGKVSGIDVYDSQGYYIGEISSKDRLITCVSKKGDKWFSFKPYADRLRVEKKADFPSYAMYTGYEDFPKLAG